MVKPASSATQKEKKRRLLCKNSKPENKTVKIPIYHRIYNFSITKTKINWKYRDHAALTSTEHHQNIRNNGRKRLREAKSQLPSEKLSNMFSLTKRTLPITSKPWKLPFAYYLLSSKSLLRGKFENVRWNVTIVAWLKRWQRREGVKSWSLSLRETTCGCLCLWKKSLHILWRVMCKESKSAGYAH